MRLVTTVDDFYIIEGESTLFKNQLFYWSTNLDGPLYGPFNNIFDAVRNRREYQMGTKPPTNLILVDFKRKKKL